MSSLVLKMTTAASHPILHTTTKTKKPYYNSSSSSSPNLNWLSSPSRLYSRFSSDVSITTPTLTRQPHHHHNHNHNHNHNHHNKYYGYGWWRITSCAPLAHKTTTTTSSLLLLRHRNLGPRFRGPHKCLCVSSSSSSSSSGSGGRSSSENQGDISGGRLMADMGSQNHKGHEWFDSQLHLNKDELLSPIENHHQSPKLLTLPTILTLGRVAAVPLLISTFYVDTWLGKTATTSIFIAAAITDWLDGYLARRMKLGSAFGAFLDPVADKLMVAATLVLLCSRPNDVTVFGQVPWLLVVPSIAIIGREITMSAVREWAASQNTKLLEAVAVNNLGKWKTATQMIALTILLASRDSSLGGPEFIVASGVVLLYISAGLAVWSLVVYMSKIWKVLLR